MMWWWWEKCSGICLLHFFNVFYIFFKLILSKIRIFKNSDFHGVMFECSGLELRFSSSPDHYNTEPFNIQTFLFRFWMFWTRWPPFYQKPFQNGTIRIGNIIQPSKIWACSAFGPPQKNIQMVWPSESRTSLKLKGHIFWHSCIQNLSHLST